MVFVFCAFCFVLVTDERVVLGAVGQLRKQVRAKHHKVVALQNTTGMLQQRATLRLFMSFFQFPQHPATMFSSSTKHHHGCAPFCFMIV